MFVSLLSIFTYQALYVYQTNCFYFNMRTGVSLAPAAFCASIDDWNG